jgi:hypothetical protein
LPGQFHQAATDHDMSEWTRDDGFVAHNAGARASRGIGLAVAGVLLGAAVLNQPAQAQPGDGARKSSEENRLRFRSALR